MTAIRAGLLLSFAMVTPCPSSAGVSTDGRVGARVTLAGPAVVIPASLGRQAGPNLFHSFDSFSIGTNGSATFTGPGSVRNVLARVTGDGATTIDGRLACAIPGANLYLLNPNGV